LTRLFISHSSKDTVPAIAFKQWLGANGWSDDDIFLDVGNIGAGERWKDALLKANARCEAVILLASPDALASPECLAEVRKAEDYGKEIIVLLLRDMSLEDHRLDSYRERQIVDLAAPPVDHRETVQYRGQEYIVLFNDNALANLKDSLFKRGLTPDHFPWPPRDKQNAEPFPGLNAFSEDDAGIFFGRDADILRALDKLRIMRRNGRPRLFVIQSASGAGKSSFLRAGLWPRLGRDPDWAPLAMLRPAMGIIRGPEGLGRRLAARLSRPRAAVNAGDIHASLMAENIVEAIHAFRQYMATAATVASEERQFAEPKERSPALLFAVDQAEELIAADDLAESQRFMALTASLINDPPRSCDLFVVFTVRSDGAMRLSQMAADHKLELPESFTLLPLPATSYRDVILKPLDVVARRGQQLHMEPLLVSQLVCDATGADALPLLAFTLSYLYQEFAAGGTISLQQYQAMGGVTRSIEMALKRALAEPENAPAIATDKTEQLSCLRAAFIPWLSRIDPESELPVRRVASLDEIPPESLAIVKRLIRARLLVADRRSGSDIVEIAHESLLRQWPDLTEWLKADALDLKTVDAIERATAEWLRNGRKEAWLDHRGERLKVAARVAGRADFRKRLGKDGLAYLKACSDHEAVVLEEKTTARARDRQRKLAQSLVGALAIALVAGVLAWKFEPELLGELYRLRHTYILTVDEERALAPAKKFRECDDCPTMIVLPASVFTMGSDLTHRKDEVPTHDVTIARFAVSQTELTFDQWDACARLGGCRAGISAGDWQRGDRPVIYVTWQDAKQYVRWLSGITGKEYRLLSESEWEYAAGAKEQTFFFFGNDDAQLIRYGWYEENAENKTHPVGGKEPNPFGLADMYGNVSEWVEDCYHDTYRGAPLNGEPWLSGDCSHRVVRGGDWQSRAASLRTTSRDWFYHDQARDTTGIRVARTLAR
jgi:formylglycine-generating enzyme required for sulfatase activity